MKKKCCITLDDIFYGLLILMCITTLFQSYITFINKMIMGIVIFVGMLSECKCLKKKAFLVYVIFFIALGVAILQSDLHMLKNGGGRSVYYFAFILIYVKSLSHFEQLKKYFIKRKKYIKTVMSIWSILVGISIFLPSSYMTSDNWGTTMYFRSYTLEGNGRIAAIALLVVSIVTLENVITKNKKWLLYYIIPSYCVLMSGARGYSVPWIFMLLIALHVYINNPKKFTQLVIPFVVLMLLFLVNSSMGEKFLYRMSQKTALSKIDTVTGGRWTPLVLCWNYFWKSSLLHKLFGNGFYAMETLIKTWSFNDFADIVITYGLLGFLPYIYCIKQYIIFLKRTHINKIIYYCLIGIWLFLAMTDLYYRTPVLIFSNIILLISCEYLSEKRKVQIYDI